MSGEGAKARRVLRRVTRASVRAVMPASLAAALVAASSTRASAAAADEEAFARVVVDAAELRTGPGVSYRVVVTAHRGETLAIDGRPGSGFWLRVLLDDGRVVYALGDEVQPFTVKASQAGEPDAPSRPGFFAPPPLRGAHGGLAIMGGALRTSVADGSTRAFGYLEARPSIVLDRTLSLDGFVADALTSDGAQILYGAGATVYFAPSWVVCPFLGLGGGGLSVIPNADSFVTKHESYYAARAGGGLLVALRWRILVRLEATNLTLFTADSFKNAQSFAGGLGVYF